MSLADLIKNKKQQKQQNKQEQQWIKKGDLEKQQQEEYLKQQEEIERKKQEQLKKKLEEVEQFYTKEPQKKVKLNENQNNKTNDKIENSTNNINGNGSSKTDTNKESLQNNEQNNNTNNKTTEKENKEEESKVEQQNNENQEPPISKQKVIKQLRRFNQVVTYFGETDWQRYQRLLQIQQKNQDDVRGTKGEENYFQKDLKQTEDEYKKQKQLEDEEDKLLLEKLKNHKFLEESLDMVKKSSKVEDLSKGVKRKTKTELVYIFLKKTLNDWDIYLENKPQEMKESIEFQKKELGVYRSCYRNLKPLFQILKDQSINDEILDSLYGIMHYVVKKNYIKAHEKYLEVSIGNAPWPMGVTMVGIHERKGRAQIASHNVAHILNDDTQRKYLQAVERLITISQTLYPNNEDPTKMFCYKLE